jgi:mannosyltransferase
VASSQTPARVSSPSRTTPKGPAWGPYLVRRVTAPTFDAVWVMLLATAISLAGAARPSFWFDEAATVSASANRSLRDLLRLLNHLDAVHGIYYVFMHGWFVIFPPTEFWSRVPSALAVGAAAAGVVALVKQFSSRSAALCSGVVFAILPRTTWAGIEARPYAFSTMAAVWTTVLLVFAIRRGKAVPWLAYAIALTASIVLDVYLVLMILVHATAVLLIRRGRPELLRFTLASCVTLILAAPFVVFARGQAAQLEWIPPLSGRTFIEVGVMQYFDRSVAFLILAAMFVAAWVFLQRSGAAQSAGDRQLVRLAVAWIVIPTVIILAYSVLAATIYYPRYLCFTAPAMAALIGVCVAGLAKTPMRISLVLAVLMLAAFPNYFYGQRGPYSKYGMDYSQVADLISQKAQPGDCFLLDDTVTWQPGPIRPLVAARPAAYRKLVDVGLHESATQLNELWDWNIAPFAVADRISECQVLWTISQRDNTVPDHEIGVALPPGLRFAQANAFWVPRDLGFRLVERWQFNEAQVIKATR